jgi:8-oxo-dGTP pyrophosphatase MutT (NUDIX family)
VFHRLVVALYAALPRKLTTVIVRVVKPTFIIGVVAVVFDNDNRVLLLKHTYHAPPWRLPGGIMERHESPLQTAAREVLEEANCTVHPLQVVHAANVGYSFDVVVVARLVESKSFSANAEVCECMWTSIDELPNIPAYQKAFIQRAATFMH